MLTGHSSRLTERELRFSREDVRLFATASGDSNPLHLDPSFARQTSFGSCIVHGALLAIGMLGTVPEENLAAITAVRLWFAGAVFPESASAVSASPSAKRAGAWALSLSGRGKLLARGVAERDPNAFARVLREPRHVTEIGATAMRVLAADPDVVGLAPGHTIAGEYSPAPELEQIARRFGAEALDPRLLEGLAWVSYVVGMELPGRHGLFSGVTLALSEPPARELPSAPELAPARHRITLRDRDERAGALVLDGTLYDRAGHPNCVAAIDAFSVPPAPAPDPRALGLADGPPAALLKRAVVVGASRGFGASLTLGLLAQGFDVDGVYAASAASAAELQRLAGPCRERLRMHRLDARDPDGVQALQSAAPSPIHGLVLSAAPPPVSMGLTADSGGQLADYVADSLRAVTVPLGALLPLIDPTEGWILFCSSSAVTVPPRDWPHYVTAKAALEGLAGWVAASAPNLRTIVLRPPAMLTALANTPSARIAAISPETVVASMARRLASGELPPGLSVLDPEDIDR